jgi:hypothetical protein
MKEWSNEGHLNDQDINIKENANIFGFGMKPDNSIR